MNKKSVYLPKARTGYHPSEKDLRSYAPDGSFTTLPNPALDDIVVNNIAWQEFDYTQSPADDGMDSLLDDDYLPDDKLEGK